MVSRRRGSRPRHVVVLGCGRSGTSNLGELFEAVPQYDHRFEPAMSELRTLPFDSRPVAVKVPTDDRARRARFTPGLPFDLEELLDAVPQPRALLWVVRHPLDTICALRPGIAADWAHDPRPDDFGRWLDRPLVERCARHWANVNGAGHDRVGALAEVVRYEDLVFRPVEAASRVLRHAGFDRRSATSTAEAWAGRVGNDEGDAAHDPRQQHWLSSGNPQAIGRWQTELGRDDVERVRPVLGTVPDKFGYEIG